MKYKSQIIEGYRHADPEMPRRHLDTLLQEALDAGVAKGWKLFSVAAASSGWNERNTYGRPDTSAANTAVVNRSHAPGIAGAQYMITLVWEVPPPTPQELEELEQQQKRTTAG